MTFRTLFSAALTLLLPVASLADAPDQVVEQGIGIAVEVESLAEGKTLREGDPVAVRFRITDTNTGTPLSGVFPAAWMDRLPMAGEGMIEEDAASCQDKVEAFIAGSLLSPPELDLNVYYVLALNDGPTLSVVDPLFGFGSTKLLDMVFLEAPGEDWVLTEDQSLLYVTMPKADAVAVVDTRTWEVIENISVPQTPGRLLLDQPGGRLWVSRQGGVSVVDTARRVVVAGLEVGPAPHRLALDRDARRAYVGAADGQLAIFEASSLEEVARHDLGAPVLGLAPSSLSRALYALAADGRVTVVDGIDDAVRSRIEIGAGASTIAFAPGDRFAFVTQPTDDVVHILDAASDRRVQIVDVEAGPDQVAFTDHLAYVRHRDSEIVLMIPLEQIGVEGQAVPVIDFPGGHTPFGEGAGSAAASIVQAPGATAVLVANPADRAIYFYKEGMAAPMGHFQNYGYQPRAVLAIDRSLRENEPGVYATTANLRRAGVYDLAFFLDTPRTIHCFRVEVAPNPEIEARRVARNNARLVAAEPAAVLAVGEPSVVRFRLLDRRTGEELEGESVFVTTFRAPGFDQRRQWARTVSPGLFEVELTPDGAGRYFVFVDAPELGLAMNGGQYLVFEAKSEASAGTASR